MPFVVSHGAVLMCSCGSCPSTLLCPPVNMVTSGKMATAVITDNVPGMNITTFGTCSLRLAAGVPLPCMYAPAGNWIPTKPTVTVKNKAVLLYDSMLNCSAGGVIKIIAPSQAMVNA